MYNTNKNREDKIPRFTRHIFVLFRCQQRGTEPKNPNALSGSVRLNTFY